MAIDIPTIERDQAIRSYMPGRGVPTLLQDPRTKSIYINPLKRYVKPFWLTTEPYEITLPAGGVSQPIPMTIDNKGHFEVIGAFYESSQAEGFWVRMTDAANKKLLTNREVHVSTFAAGGGVTTNYSAFGPDSSGGRIYRWPDSFWLKVDERGRAIHAVFRNLAPVSNTIRFVLYGFRWYHSLADQRLADQIEALYNERRKIEPFFYTTDQFVKLARGQSAEFDIRFTDGMKTEWIKSTSASTGTFDVLIEEKTTRKGFMTHPTPSDVVFGQGELPFGLWESALFEENTKLTLSLTNTHPGDNTIWITLGCRHILLSENRS